ncbi:MAG TPA: hypothetical protein DIW80_06655 [Gordonia polyisoprenivorans]|uniref:hypothetical protein n=1 Tax=Gordonia sp. N1V TaxID=3034163 RepID=UPI000EBE5604|nr:hypothetical protein [Gordonia sp. N1V]MDF3284568.1 hypothetical protein [Gordonia sp. N1V]HCS56944.1 hypothetical protein [Gordonia polyisoprenivorans]
MEPVVSRLTLESFESLPPHARRCVFWEVDPSMAGPLDQPESAGHTEVVGRGEIVGRGVARAPFESEFDKEAWISSVLLEWGACGQLATDPATGVIVGTAFYAPPGRVPRSRLFPTSPVSADAILLTSIQVEPGYEEVATPLLDAVLVDLMRRGVRAVEAFGLVRGGGPDGAGSGTARRNPTPDATPGMRDISEWSDEEIVSVAREILDNPQPDLCTRCLLDAAFLKASGFDVVASHARFPRLRLELDEGLGWKSEVEGALEKLVVMAAIDMTGRERTFAPVGRRL